MSGYRREANCGKTVYEFLYTSIGQAIAAYAVNDYFAAVMNPLILGAGLVSFAGVVVPYADMQPFWKYWLYWLDPFHYLMAGLFGTVVWGVKVTCKPEELTTFGVPSGQTCGSYMADFLRDNSGYVVDAAATDSCSYCPYASGAEYAKTFNINADYYPWRDVSLNLGPVLVPPPGWDKMANACFRLASRRSFAFRRTVSCFS